jgi:hypothetical protein
VEDIMKQGMADADTGFEEYWPALGGGTGIFSATTEQAPAKQGKAIYNLSGQRVCQNYKGVVIINGKKYVQ